MYTHSAILTGFASDAIKFLKQQEERALYVQNKSLLGSIAVEMLFHLSSQIQSFDLEEFYYLMGIFFPSGAW